MRNTFLLIQIFCCFSVASFGQPLFLKKGILKNGNTEIIISHFNAVYSMARYFDICDKSYRYRTDIFKSIEDTSKLDSLRIYPMDEYHNELFKRTRKILFANYDSIISYVNTLEIDDTNLCYGDNYKSSYFYDDAFEGHNSCANIFKTNQIHIDSLETNLYLEKLIFFANLINYDNFYYENYNVYQDYLEQKIPCIEDIRIWMNEMFDVYMPNIKFLTSPFADPLCIEAYDDFDNDTILIIGGVPVIDELCCFSSDYRLFELLMNNVVEQLNDDKNNEMFSVYGDVLYYKLQITLFFLYCHDTQLNEIFEFKQSSNWCKLNKLFGLSDFSIEVEPLYNYILRHRDIYDKNLLHICIDLLENME